MQVEIENKIFDLVLNLNNLSNIKSGLEKVKDNAIAAEEQSRLELTRRVVDSISLLAQPPRAPAGAPRMRM